ncbi:MAG: hypothetical protein AAGC53_13360 [Actinomycetota bacterium]
MTEAELTEARPPAGGAWRQRWRALPVGAQRVPLWILLGMVLLQPTPHRVGSTVVGDLGDSMFLTWTLSWGAEALRTDPLDAFDASIFHPEPQALALSDPMLSVAPIFGVFEWLTGDAIAALNLTMFVLFVIALASSHALGMRLFGRPDAALVMAIVTCCNGYVFGQQNHPQLQTFGFVSLGFVLLLATLERRRDRDAIGLGLAVTAMVLSVPLYGLIWVLGALVVVGALWLQGSLAPIRHLVRPGAVSVATAAIVVGPVAKIYLDVDERNGLARGYEPSGSLTPTDFLTPHRGNWSWGTTLDGINSVGKAGEHWFFLGFSVIVLGIVGFVRLGVLLRRNADALRTGIRIDEIAALSAAALAALALAVGPSPGGLPGPFRAFHRFVPGFDGIRVTSRFTVVAVVALAALVALSYQFLTDRFAGRWHRFAAPLLVVVILVEVGGPAGRVEVPEGDQLAAYEVLADLPDGAVVELPIKVPGNGISWPFVEAPRMYHSLTDRNTRINGYSGAVPAGFEATAGTLNQWPSPDAIALTESLELRYVLLHGEPEATDGAFSAADLATLGEQAVANGYRVIPAGDDLVVILE